MNNLNQKTKDWETKNFENCIEKVIYPKKILKKNFLEEGRYPVISQESNYINGYYSDEKNLFKITKPIVVFGDHTKVFKYIDFDFILGADGVKILDPKDFLNPRFFFYHLKSINLKDLGYARHYKLLKELEISFPKSLAEQKRIVDILDEAFENIDQAKSIAEQNLKNIEELFESELQSVFSNNNEEWETNTLGEVCEMIKRGSAPKYTEKEGSTIVLNQKCIRNHSIDYLPSRMHDSSVKKINQERFIQLGDGLINSTGVGTLGRVAQVRELEVEAFVDTHITIVRPKKELFFLDFFGWILIFIENIIKESGEGASGQTELSRTKLKNDFYVSFPKSLSEQQKIVERLDELKEKVDEGAAILLRKIAALDELKKSLLQKAFNGEL